MNTTSASPRKRSKSLARHRRRTQAARENFGEAPSTKTSGLRARKIISSMRGSTPLWVLGLVLIAAATRIIPHPWNFTAAGAMAYFAGLRIPSRFASLAVVMGLLLLTDTILGFYNGMEWVYFSTVAMAMVGWFFRDNGSIKTLAGGFIASVTFFVVSNFGVWAAGGVYKMNLQGLMECFTLALPFFRNQMFGDMIYLSAFLLVEAVFFSRRAVLKNI